MKDDARCGTDRHPAASRYAKPRQTRLLRAIGAHGVMSRIWHPRPHPEREVRPLSVAGAGAARIGLPSTRCPFKPTRGAGLSRPGGTPAFPPDWPPHRHRQASIGWASSIPLPLGVPLAHTHGASAQTKLQESVSNIHPADRLGEDDADAILPSGAPRGQSAIGQAHHR